LQDFSTRQAGKRPAQTVSNGCEYGFLNSSIITYAFVRMQEQSGTARG